MSTRYDIVCHRCKETHLLGFMRGAGMAFGYGSEDYDVHASVGRFIVKHVL